VVNPSPEPIWIDVGCEALGLYVSWIIQDGNHRLAAALYRGDTTIRVSAGGDMDVIESLEWKG